MSVLFSEREIPVVVVQMLYNSSGENTSVLICISLNNNCNMGKPKSRNGGIMERWKRTPNIKRQNGENLPEILKDGMT